MCAPSVPCTLLTPLSPHSLSFRPLIIPENADLLVRLPQNARSHARCDCDMSLHFCCSVTVQFPSLIQRPQQQPIMIQCS
jgi:NAD kinase